MLGGGGGVSHPSQLTTGLVIKSVTTSPTLAGERMLFILQVSILSEQLTFCLTLDLPQLNPFSAKPIFGRKKKKKKKNLENFIATLVFMLERKILSIFFFLYLFFS